MTSSLVASDGGLSSCRVLEEMILGLEKRLRLGRAKVQLHPLLVDGLRNSLGFDSSFVQPSTNGIDAVLGRRKEVVYLLWSVVFPVRCRVWIRSGSYQ